MTILFLNTSKRIREISVICSLGLHVRNCPAISCVLRKLVTGIKPVHKMSAGE